MGRANRLWVGLAALAASVVLAGCMDASSNVTYSDKGQLPGDATLSQIHPGQTTEAWVRSVLGSPTEDKALDDGSRLLKYVYTKQKHDHITFSVLLNANNDTQWRHTLYFEVRDGRVQKFWQS